jgi:hypothetical protein
MTELECQIEQDDGNYFILYIVVQRALEERKRLYSLTTDMSLRSKFCCSMWDTGTKDSTVTSITLASIPFPVHCAWNNNDCANAGSTYKVSNLEHLPILHQNSLIWHRSYSVFFVQ